MEPSNNTAGRGHVNAGASPGMEKINSLDRPDYHGARQKPRQSTKPEDIMQDDNTFRAEVADELEQFLGGDIFDEKDRAEMRKELAQDLNKLIDIPFIGEKVEGFIIRALLRVGEFVAIRFARKYGGKVADKLRGITG